MLFTACLCAFTIRTFYVYKRVAYYGRLHPWNTKGWMPFLCFVLMLVCINHVFFTTFYFGAFFAFFTNIYFCFTQTFLQKNYFYSNDYLYFKYVFFLFIFFSRHNSFSFIHAVEEPKHINISNKHLLYLFFLPHSVYKQLGGTFLVFQ